MIKKKFLYVLLCTMLASSCFISCGKTTDATSKKEDSTTNQQQPSSNNNDNTKNHENDNEPEQPKEFNIYNNIINVKLRASDLELALRNPDQFKDKIFTFGGHVLQSKTNENGTQEILLDVIDKQNINPGEQSKFIKVKVEYNPNEFDGKRLLKDDKVAFSASLLGLTNSDNEDILEFKALSSLNMTDYLAMLALNSYFESMGLSSGEMDLKLIPEDKYKDLLGEETLASYKGMGKQVCIFTTKNDTYWDCVFSYDDPNGVSIGTGKKDSNGQILFESKGDISFYSYNF